MTHRFPIKEIARQAGLGTATVDRAINNRAHVSPQTRARVEAAIQELAGQEAQLAARGRRMFFDFIIEAPNRFSREVREATQQVLPEIGAAVCRPRFFTQEIMTEAEVLQALARVGKRGSHGICLKVRDLPSVRRAVDALSASGIPVVTLVTDVKTPGRIGYVGLDNRSAGRTAAYLASQMLGDAPGSVLATRSNDRFAGEEERETAFTEALAVTRPNLRIVHMSGGSGVHHQTSRLMEQVIDRLSGLRCVYSMGGGNHSILEALDAHGLRPDLYIAHDLDRENRALIAAGRLTFILHHDLKEDMHNVFRAFLSHHKLMSGAVGTVASHIQIISPDNIPPYDGFHPR